MRRLGPGLELLLRLRRRLVRLREVVCFCCLFCSSVTCRVKSLKVNRRLDMGKGLCLIMSCSSLEDLDFLPQLCNVRDKAEDALQTWLLYRLVCSCLRNFSKSGRPSAGSKKGSSLKGLKLGSQQSARKTKALTNAKQRH